MIYILLGDGFEEIEAIAPIDILRRAGIDIKLVSLYPDRLTVRGSHSISVECEITIDKISSEYTDMVILPGGTNGVHEIRSSVKAVELIRECFDKKRYIAAICAAPTVLSEMDILVGREATCYPSMKGELQNCTVSDKKVVVSGRVITAEAAGSAVEFGFALVEVLKGPEASAEVRAAIHA